MNDRLSPDDPQLTAYALGELEGDERAAVEAALRRDPALRMFVDDIRAAASRIESALADEAVLPVSRLPASVPSTPERPIRRGPPPVGAGETKRINGSHPHRRRPTKLLAFPQLYFVVGGCAAAGVALFIALQPAPGPATAPRDTATVAKVSAGAPVAVTLPTIEPTVSDNAHVTVASTAEITVAPAELTGEARDRDESLAGGLALIDQARPAEIAPIEFKFNIPSIGLIAANGGAIPIGPGVGLRPVTPPVIAPGDFQPNPIDRTSQAYVPRRNEMKFSIPGFKFGPQPEENRLTPAPAQKPAEPAAPPLRATPERVPASSDAITPEVLERARASVVPSSGTDLFSGPRRIGVGGRRDTGRAGRGHFQRTDGFVSVAQTTLAAVPLSRETASYADVQRSLRTRQLPRPPAVRIEEMLNSFPWRYAAPASPDEPFAASLEVAEAPWAPTHRLVRIGVKAREDGTNANAAAVAKDALARVEFNPEKVSGYRLIGYEAGAPDEPAASPEPTRANEVAAGMTFTVLYEIVLAGTVEGGPDVVVLIDDLKYGTPRKGRPALPTAIAQELLTLTVQYQEPAGEARRKLEFPLVDSGARFAAASPDFKFAAAVAGFGMILRNSPQKGAATMGNVIEWATSGVTSAQDDADGSRAEFIALARQAQALLRGE